MKEFRGVKKKKQGLFICIVLYSKVSFATAAPLVPFRARKRRRRRRMNRTTIDGGTCAVVVVEGVARCCIKDNLCVSC
jgi:hypothetical protein